MSDASIPDKKNELLSDEELRSLARRHAAQFRNFRERRRRERELREREFELRSLASRAFAAGSFHASQNSETPPPAPRKSVPASKKTVEKNAAPHVPARRPAIPFPRKKRARFAPALSATPLAKFLRKIGAEGLSASLILHLGLIIFALFWVVSTYVETKEDTPPEFFFSGSGGGRDGDRPSYADVQATRRNAGKINAARREHKIVSKVAKSSVVLPEMPALPHTTTFTLAPARSTPAFGNLSSGSGGGLGGGIGAGTGVGIGGARNFVGKIKTTQKILGTNVTAEKLAVYMDNSGSMTTVIPIVRAEILKKFPTADVYEIFGCRMNRLPDEALRPTKSWTRERNNLLKKFSREKKALDNRAAARKIEARQKKNSRKNGFLENDSDTSWTLGLSSYGTALLNELLGGDVHAIDLGNWLDAVVTDGGYDAIFVFADFQDYADGELSNEETVQKRWLNSARKHEQRFYFFTTEMMPQNIFRTLAERTGGEIAIPKETAKQSFEAQLTAKELKKLKQRKKPTVPADSAKQNFDDEESEEEENFDESENEETADAFDEENFDVPADTADDFSETEQTDDGVPATGRKTPRERISSKNSKKHLPSIE